MSKTHLEKIDIVEIEQVCETCPSVFKLSQIEENTVQMYATYNAEYGCTMTCVDKIKSYFPSALKTSMAL